MEQRRISNFARNFVERKFAAFFKRSAKTLSYEKFAQDYTDRIDALLAKVKRPDLREYIHSEARKDCNYVPSETGRWMSVDPSEDKVWCGNKTRAEALIEKATTPSTKPTPKPERGHGISR